MFCHFPHSGNGWPLWNRDLEADGAFTPIDLASLDFLTLEGGPYAPNDDSKLCLSCHSALTEIGAVNMLETEMLGPGEVIGLDGTGGTNLMPAGSSGASSGFTRRIGADLTNDHPISFTYNSALVTADGELRSPSLNISVECHSCHDPHFSDTDPAPRKFLAYNRFQQAAPTGGAFSEANDIICLRCHDKDVGALQWSKSAHADPAVANEVYSAGAAGLRQFATAVPVWSVACLNCHDSHSVQGARHGLREGVNEIATTPASTAKTGGDPAQEETCFQCHTNSTESALSSVATVPNIEDAFKLARRMPITAADQPIDPATTDEVHDILNADLQEDPVTLGLGQPLNRHVECADCHNPHRVIKKRTFNADPATPDAGGTHDHSAPHSNLASGVLRGTFGVEPDWGTAGTSFHTLPTSFVVKRGDGGVAASTAVGAAWVTREYQVCLKCHSNYAYSTPPNLGTPYTGTTPSATNQMTAYTNQAQEFQAPSTHSGEPLSVGTSGGAASSYNTNNHRSWHPVMGATGRTNAMRGTTTSSFTSPFNSTYTGSQTIYCSDCHGASTTAASYSTTPTGGEDGDPWGPHGSTNNFILKGEWDSSSGVSSQANTLCFKCHTRAVYATSGGSSNSGFYNSSKGGLHSYHVDRIGRIQCTWCHVAVPHGWKNKALLVNLNDVGPEVGLGAGTQVRNRTTAVYNRGPYYLGAILKVYAFGASGNWAETACGSSGFPGNGIRGRDWMRDSNENCDNPP